MRIADPSVKRYQNLRQKLEKYPANRDGTKMNLESIDVPEENGSITHGSCIDSDPQTSDILHLSRNSFKGDHTSETFLELPEKRSFWGGVKQNQRLVHLSRNVNRVAGGYGLSEIAIRTVDLLTGEVTSESKGEKALKEAQNLEKRIPFRLHNINPVKSLSEEDQWLLQS